MEGLIMQYHFVIPIFREIQRQYTIPHSRAVAQFLQAAKQARLEKFEIPTKIKLIPEPWMPESGLVTAALKLKREIIKKAYEKDLAQLYC